MTPSVPFPSIKFTQNSPVIHSPHLTLWKLMWSPPDMRAVFRKKCDICPQAWKNCGKFKGPPHLSIARYNIRSSLEPYQLDRVPSHLSYNSKGE